MKRVVIYALLTGILANNPAVANGLPDREADAGLELWQAAEPSQPEQWTHYPSEWQGGGIGGVAGALIAGPPGFIVGAVSGVLAGRNAGLSSDLHTARREVDRLKQERQEMTETMDRRQQQSRQAYQELVMRCQALVTGLSYHLHFRTNQSTLDPAELPDLTLLAGALGGVRGLTLNIHAYADRRGRTKQNRLLSKARAETVARLLIGQGVKAEQIVQHAYGESQAHYPLSDAEGMGYDRQVVIRFHYQEAK